MGDVGPPNDDGAKDKGDAPSTKKSRLPSLQVPIVGLTGLKPANEAQNEGEWIATLLSDYNSLKPWAEKALLAAAEDPGKVMNRVWDIVIPAVSDLLKGRGPLTVNSTENCWTAPYKREATACGLNNVGKFLCSWTFEAFDVKSMDHRGSNLANIFDSHRFFSRFPQTRYHILSERSAAHLFCQLGQRPKSPQ